uniref:Uncharacterized protein n=1 Tax=Timema genevievae TaxID=629358 RepID=A0A7R9K5X0_TIMGE|nr:unnamed protein product [Timema genevievae]
MLTVPGIFAGESSNITNAEDIMTGRREGGKELGKRGRDNIQSITISTNDYLAHQGGIKFLMCVSTVGCSRLMTSADSVSVSHTSMTSVSIKSLQYRAMGVDHIARRLTATSMKSQTSQRLTQLGAREATRMSPVACFSLMTTIR